MTDKPLTLTVYLRKGGVGKTTLVALLGQFLAALGYRVVIIDLDRQGSQSAVFDLVGETGRGGEILHLVLKRRVDILAALAPVAVPRLAGHADFAPVMDEVAVAQQVHPELAVLGIVPMMTRYYFEGLRKSQNVQAGEEFLKATYGELVLRDGKAMLDFPYHEEVHKAMWAGVSLLSEEVNKPVRADVLRLLNGIAARLGLEEVAHV